LKGKQMATTRPTLKKGMSGKAGSAIGDAIFLWRNYIGLPPAAGVTVFDFGTQSHDRTVAWQKAQKLSSTDGKVGQQSWARYDSLQYGPPTAAAVQAAEQIKSPEPPPPAAVQAAKVIQEKKPPPKPSAAAVTAAAKIPKPTKPPSSAVSTTTKLTTAATDIKTAAVEASGKVTKAIEGAPLWVRIAGTTLGVVVALKGLKRVFNF
jgi:outer membrane biosynthesis protein TonB